MGNRVKPGHRLVRQTLLERFPHRDSRCAGLTKKKNRLSYRKSWPALRSRGRQRTGMVAVRRRRLMKAVCALLQSESRPSPEENLGGEGRVKRLMMRDFESLLLRDGATARKTILLREGTLSPSPFQRWADLFVAPWTNCRGIPFLRWLECPCCALGVSSFIARGRSTLAIDCDDHIRGRRPQQEHVMERK